MAVAADLVLCSLCSFRTRTVSEWISHLRLVHFEDKEFIVTCGINGCISSYNKCSSFLSHVYRHHRDVIISRPGQVQLSSAVEEIDITSPPSLASTSYTAVDDFSHEHSILDHRVHQILGIDISEQQKKSALFILYLKEVKGLSETAIQSVIAGYENMLHYSVSRIAAGVYERLSLNGVDVQQLRLGDCFDCVSDPFDGLKTVHMQEKYYSETLGSIVSYYQLYYAMIIFLVMT